MQIVIRVAPRVDRSAGEGSTVPRFELLPGRDRRFGRAFAVSLCLHAAAAMGAPAAMVVIESWRVPVVNLNEAVIRRADAMPLLVRAPDPRSLPKLRFRPVRQKAEGERRETRAAGQRPAARPRTASVKSLEEVASAILLQPGQEKARPEQALALRSLSVWSGPNRLRTAAPIVPGSVEPLPSRVDVSLHLSVDMPLPGPVRASVAAPAPPAPGEARKPRIFVPPSGALPLRSAAPQLEEPALAGGDVVRGDPAAIMILSGLRPKPGEILAIPPGNLVVLGSGTGSQIRRESEAAKARAPGADESAAANAAASAEAGAASKPGAKGPGKADLAAARRGEAPGSAGDGNLGAAAEGRDEGASNGDRTSGVGGPSAKGTAAARTIHTPSGEILARVDTDGSILLSYPADGNFDVVVVDAALPEPVTDFSSALSGRPVHTAYLNVGEPVEWVLHYCLPGQGGAARQQHAVVTLDAPRRLKAPYVVEAVLPPQFRQRWTGYQAFHALLTTAGRLEQARILRAGSAGAELLEALKRWTFRPAFLGGSPASVEVLLVVPPPRAGVR